MKKGKLLFHALIEVESHGILKNSKQIFRNKKTGKCFISSSDRAKKGGSNLVGAFLKLKHQFKHETILDDVIAEFIFVYPKTKYFTKAGHRNKKLGDLSNLYQLVEDSLQKAGIIFDDGQIVNHGDSRRDYHNGPNPCLAISLFKAIDQEL